MMIGTRVRYTALARKMGVSSRHLVGTVVGAARDGYGVRVRWDGLSPSTVYVYHPDFLEEAEEDRDERR